MLCQACAKIALLPSQRDCLRCLGIISNHLSVICDHCSDAERLCSLCLKKTYADNKSKVRGNCKSCGKR